MLGGIPQLPRQTPDREAYGPPVVFWTSASGWGPIGRGYREAGKLESRSDDAGGEAPGARALSRLPDTWMDSEA